MRHLTISAISTVGILTLLAPACASKPGITGDYSCSYSFWKQTTCGGPWKRDASSAVVHAIGQVDACLQTADYVHDNRRWQEPILCYPENCKLLEPDAKPLGIGGNGVGGGEAGTGGDGTGGALNCPTPGNACGGDPDDMNNDCPSCAAFNCCDQKQACDSDANCQCFVNCELTGQTLDQCEEDPADNPDACGPRGPVAGAYDGCLLTSCLALCGENGAHRGPGHGLNPDDVSFLGRASR